MKPEWGSKHECPGCGAHFYDMRKPEAKCPKCGTLANDRATLVAKKGELNGNGAAKAKKAAPKKSFDDDFDDSFQDMDDDLDLGDDDDEFLEDTDDLVGDDETDMSEIMEHIDEGVSDQNV